MAKKAKGESATGKIRRLHHFIRNEQKTFDRLKAELAEERRINIDLHGKLDRAYGVVDDCLGKMRSAAELLAALGREDTARLLRGTPGSSKAPVTLCDAPVKA